MCNFHQTFLLFDHQLHFSLKSFLLSAIVESHEGPKNASEKKGKKKLAMTEVNFCGLKLIDFGSTCHRHYVRKMSQLVRQT